MSRLFLCPNCGKDTLQNPCSCGQVVPQYVLDRRLPIKEKPDWLKEMERHIDDP